MTYYKLTHLITGEEHVCYTTEDRGIVYFVNDNPIELNEWYTCFVENPRRRVCYQKTIWPISIGGSILRVIAVSDTPYDTLSLNNFKKEIL